MSSSASCSSNENLLSQMCTNSVYYLQDYIHFLSIFLSGKDSKGSGLCSVSINIKEELSGTSQTDLEGGKVSGGSISGQPVDQFKIFVLSYAPIEGFNESICILDLQFSRLRILDHFQHAAGQIIVIATTEKLND